MLNKTLLPTEAKVELQKWQMFQKCNTGWCIACLQFICTVMAISFGNDKCCVLQGLLVQYLRKMFSHVSIEYWNTIRHISYFLSFFGANIFKHIVPSFTAVDLLLKSNQNDRVISPG